MKNRIIANIKWYSEETDEGWIDAETADHIFPNGNWNQLGYDELDEYTNSYGLVFTYIKKKQPIKILSSHFWEVINDDEWDEQIRQDYLDGKFDKLIEEVRQKIRDKNKSYTT